MLLLLVFLVFGSAQKHDKHARPSFFRRMNPDNTFSEEYPAPRPFISQIDDAVTLVVTPGGPINGDVVTVTVTWSGVPYPTTNDWLGFYCPATSAASDYLDYQWNTNGKASGSATFIVTNMRDSFEFRYIANNTAYILLATSNVVSWVPHQPLQGRVALTGRTGEMIVTWNSDQSNTSATPFVTYGTKSNSYTNNATGGSHTYKATDMCNAPASTVSAQNYRDPGWFHDVLLSSLSQNTRYYYRYGQNGVWSDEHTFMTPPVTGPTTATKFVMYGDHGAVGCFRDNGGCSEAPTTVQRVLNEVNNNGYNLILHIGDLAYAVGYGYLWEMWGTEVEPVSTSAPYMVSIGNHEYDHTGTGGHDPSGATGSGWHPSWGNYGDDSGGECSVPTYHRFKSPANGNSIYWYSFNYGNVHFIIMSTEHDFTPGSAQYNWLQNDLASVDRSVTPWVVLNAHRPMYSSENYPSDWMVAENMQTAFEPLINKYQVDIMLTGHYHAYERTCPVYQQKCCATGTNCTTHIVAGMAGIGLDTAGWFKSSWSAFHDESHWGYVRVQTTATSLKLEYVNDDNGAVLDSVVLNK